MKIFFKKLSNEAKTPLKAHEYDAGLDLFSTYVNKKNEYWEYGTGISISVPLGFVGLLFPRSSISKTNHFLRNSVGVIDSGYTGEVKIRMSPGKNDNLDYKIGEKIAQLIVIEIPILDLEEVFEDLNKTPRGDSGFGSSGK
jgi:dUTP pyrophosphatase